MLLASDPDQTFTIGLAEETFAPQPGEAAFTFRYMTARALREYRAFGTDIDGRLKRPDNEVSEELFDRLHQKLARWSNPSYQSDVSGPSDLSNLADFLTESEAWHLFWRMCSANRLGPDALKNFGSPSPADTEGSAPASAKTAETLPTP